MNAKRAEEMGRRGKREGGWEKAPPRGGPFSWVEGNNLQDEDEWKKIVPGHLRIRKEEELILTR